MSSDISQCEWLLDSVLSFLKSPSYTVPVMDFIDQHCVVFDSEEENKFAYTDIHKEFVEVVFQQLETFLDELGITQEEFADACARGISSGGDNAFVFQQIMAAENFTSFKKMMVKRNKDLEHEALKMLQTQQLRQPQESAEIVASAPAPPAEEEEDQELQEALRLSKMGFTDFNEQEQRELEEAIRISQQEQGGGAAQSDAEREDAELQEALRLSLSEELKRAQLEKERAELEHARQMQELLEEERRLREAEREAEAKKAEAAAASAAPSSDLASVSSLPPIGINKDREREIRAQAVERIGKEQALLRKRQEENEKQRAEMEEHRSTMDAEQQEFEKRSAHLKQQRDKLIEKKKQEREVKLKQYEQAQQKAQKEIASTTGAGAAFLASLEAPTQDPAAAAAAAAESAELTAEQRRLEMRRALAKRIKQDILEDEEKRLVGEKKEGGEVDEERSRQLMRIELERREAVLSKK